jgi:hypothetical protein
MKARSDWGETDEEAALIEAWFAEGEELSRAAPGGAALGDEAIWSGTVECRTVLATARG